jgi:hypothetical protein
MRKAPRNRAESPQEHYEECLQRGLHTQKRYEALEEELGAAYDSHDSAAIERLGGENRLLSERIDRLLGERVALLRRTEKLKTLEDAFPAVREPTSGESSAQADEIAAIFAHGSHKIEATRRFDPEKDWSVDDWRAFQKACNALAREHGYRVNRQSNDFTRNGLTFSHVIYPRRSEAAMTRNGRIVLLFVADSKDDVLNYDRGSWDMVTTNAETQREIDRFVAIFG